jgi:hypothetical protein
MRQVPDSGVPQAENELVMSGLPTMLNAFDVDLVRRGIGQGW